jgi:O-antigen/teichoic acid export membrane protein
MAILNMLFIPVYLKYIGSEGYGLIGLFASIQSLLYILDSGFSTTLNKELASLSADSEKKQQILNLVKTLESFYWPVAILVGIIALIASYFLAHNWVQSEGLTEKTVFHCFLLLSVTFVFQFPIGFYAGGLLGLQRHLLYNAIRVLFAFIKNGGAVLILMFYSTSVIVFFSWNLVITVITVFIFQVILKKIIKAGDLKAYFDRSELKRVAKFSGGMAAIALSATLMMQADKVILSKRLLLADFGYYTIAVTLGMAVLQVIGPISQSFFPKFSYLNSLNEKGKLQDTYHRAGQLASIIVFPASIILVLYSKEVLMLWTNNAVTVEKTWYIARLFAIGTALNAIVSILFSFCFALNWTKFVFGMSIYSAFIVMPAIAIVTWFYGPVGAATCWIVSNAVYVLIIPPLVHQKFFKAGLSHWYWHDTFRPFTACLAFNIIAYVVISTNTFTRAELLVYFCTLGCLSILVTTLFSDKIKSDLYLLTSPKKRKI